MNKLDIKDERTPFELVQDDDHRWPAGFITALGPDIRPIYIPPQYTGLTRRRFLRALLLSEAESPEDAAKRRDDFHRASGHVVCGQCGEMYYNHPADPVDGFLNIVCDRSRVKL